MEIIFAQVQAMMLLFIVQILFRQDPIIVCRLMRRVKVMRKLNGFVLKLQWVQSVVLVILANVIQVSGFNNQMTSGLCDDPLQTFFIVNTNSYESLC